MVACLLFVFPCRPSSPKNFRGQPNTPTLLAPARPLDVRPLRLQSPARRPQELSRIRTIGQSFLVPRGPFADKGPPLWYRLHWPPVYPICFRGVGQGGSSGRHQIGRASCRERV